MVMKKVGGPVGEMMLARPPDQKGALLAKHPSSSLALNAQLVVDPDETAVFVAMGSFAGQLGPGRHLLSPSGVPFLARLSAPGNPSAFQADLVFVTSRPLPMQRFGGPVGMQRDRTGNTAQVRVFGSYTLWVTDPARLVVGLVGAGAADATGALRQCGERVVQRVGACIAEWLSGGYFELGQLPGIGPQLAAAVPPHLAHELEGWGLVVQSLDEVSVQVR
jgi:membrane protease subunit (stomatin/prohibitin family)